MGLDNGIVLVAPEGKQLPEYADSHHYKNNCGEVCYWRKCWGIREAILKVLDPEGKREAEIQCGDYPVEAEDIPAIIRALKPFFSKEYWDENADSIWEYDDIFNEHVNHILKLGKLKEFLENNKDCSAYFYDSY